MIRVATFNLNNLFDRFNFHATIPERALITATYRWRVERNRAVVPPDDEDAPDVFEEGGETIVRGSGPSVGIEVGPSGRLVRHKNKKHVDSLLLRADRINADVLAVQEIENIEALRTFNQSLDAPYPFVVLLEGNDPRFIDVGVLSKLPIGRALSHRWEPDSEPNVRFVFGRDLLAVDILSHDRSRLFTLWVNHLKSKFIDPRLENAAEIQAANEKNDKRRERQAKAVHDIIRRHHDIENDLFAVCGDMNDSPDSGPLSPLVGGELRLHDVIEGAPTIEFEHPDGRGPNISNLEDEPPSEDWTHRHSVSNAPDKYERFDQIYLSKKLHEKKLASAIQRRTHWGKQHSGTDHDPVRVDLDLAQ